VLATVIAQVFIDKATLSGVALGLSTPVGEPGARLSRGLPCRAR
jgi:hypothetical protein